MCGRLCSFENTTVVTSQVKIPCTCFVRMFCFVIRFVGVVKVQFKTIAFFETFNYFCRLVGKLTRGALSELRLNMSK